MGRSIKRSLHILLVICLFAGLFVFSFPQEEAKAASYLKMSGIDYDRIYYGNTRGSSLNRFDVTFTLGDLKFKGELAGGLDLPLEKINEIIEQVLSEKGLTEDDVMMVAIMSATLQDGAARYWGDQVLQGLLKFLPAPSGIDFGDIYASVVHNEVKDVIGVIYDLAKDQALDNVTDFLYNYGTTMNKLQPGKTVKYAKFVPMLGHIITTLEIVHDWRSDNERFAKYLKGVEDAIADVNDFYATCNQRINQFAEDNTMKWTITFKDATVMYNYTFWGISGLKAKWKLNGELTQTESLLNAGAVGSYHGDLYLEINGKELHFDFDEKFLDYSKNIPIIGYLLDDVRLKGGSFTDLIQHTTRLKRNTMGTVGARIESTIGNVQARLTGSMNNHSDVTEFSFDHTLTSDAPHSSVLRRYFNEFKFSTQDTAFLYCERNSFGITYQGVRYDYATDEFYMPKMNEGTIWKPLESQPIITIHFK